MINQYRGENCMVNIEDKIITLIKYFETNDDILAV
jgi:hypothetical protein